jgi:hypothetical protein
VVQVLETEIEKLRIQEEKRQQEKQGEGQDKNEVIMIAMGIHYSGNMESSAVHAASTFKPIRWAKGTLNDQVYDQHAAVLTDAQPIKTDSVLKMKELQKLRVQEEKQGREQDEDGEIITLMNKYEDGMEEAAVLLAAVLTNAQPIKTDSVLKMKELQKLRVQEEKQAREHDEGGEIITLMNKYEDSMEEAAVLHAAVLTDAQPIKTDSILKMKELQKLRVQEEKQGREHDEDGEIITLMNTHGSNGGSAALIITVVLLLIAQVVRNSCQSSLQSGQNAQVGLGRCENTTTIINLRTSQQRGLLTRACLLMAILQPTMAQGAQSSRYL